jgi:hypothetical protein
MASRDDRPAARAVRATLTVALAVLLTAAGCAQRPPASLEVEDEVLGNILAQPVGNTTLESLDLPEPFLRRVADRIVRSTFLDRYRRVAVSRDPGPAAEPQAAGARSEANATFRRIERTVRVSGEIARYRRGLQPGRPALRGYRVPLLDDAENRWPSELPEDPDSALWRAADRVATELAREGLLPTLARVLEDLGPEAARRAGEGELDLLRATGLPVDWLGSFRPAGESREEASTGAAETVKHVARLVFEESVNGSEVPERFGFAFRPSDASYRVAVESGSLDARTFRVQLTRGDYWSGRPDGGSVDIARQLMLRFPESRFLISIEDRFVATLERLAGTWGLPVDQERWLLHADGPISQWAQDNGKAGVLIGDDGEEGAPATLVPRFASRREDGSEFLPAESFVVETLVDAGHAVIPSPLSFQGGDLLAVRDPSRGERMLFLGEAEVYRNSSLGLTRDQVLEAFRVEFGVDRCEVLPSLSFHIDFDVTFREHGDEVVAFVNDRESGARILVELALAPLREQGTLSAGDAERARELLRTRKDKEAAALLLGALEPHRIGPGVYSGGLTRGFEDSGRQSDVANFQRFLFSLDVLDATAGETAPSDDAHERAYVRSLLRHRELRDKLAGQLSALGFRVVPVPGFSEGAYSVSYINGIQTRRGYLMPTYGGFLEPLDDAAGQAIRDALGGTVVVDPVECPESQRRLGGVHCSVAAYP